MITIDSDPQSRFNESFSSPLAWDSALETRLLLSLSFAMLSASYYLLIPRFPKPKQAAWILTTVSSAFMTLASLPFLYDYLRHEGGVKGVGMRPALSVAANRFFQSYLMADLLYGTLHYQSQLNLLTGWIHHIVYIWVVEVAIRYSWTHIFCLCAVMEIPTFILGIMTLNPLLRSNVLFALAFFFTRILFHIVLAISYFRNENRMQATDGSLIPALILAMMFPLHVMWFHGCVKGFIRRRGEQTQPKSSDASVFKLEIVPGGSSFSIIGSPSDNGLGLSIEPQQQQEEYKSTLQVHNWDQVSPPSTLGAMFTKIYGTIPPRETVYEYVGLGKKPRIERYHVQAVEY